MARCCDAEAGRHRRRADVIPSSLKLTNCKPCPHIDRE
jgi:hypothetical protein